MVAPDNTGRKQRGQFPKGKSGNPAGKPKGSRNKTTLAMEALLDGEPDAIVRRRLRKPRRRRCVAHVPGDSPAAKDVRCFNLPPIKTAADALTATGALVAAVVAAGDLTPSEAAELLNSLKHT